MTDIDCTNSVTIKLNFTMKVENKSKEQSTYDIPVSQMVCGGMHKCGMKKSEIKKDAPTFLENDKMNVLVFKESNNNIHIAACDECLMYDIFITTSHDNILTSTINCPICNRFYNYAQINNVKYHFCEKCQNFYGSGPVTYIMDKKQFQDIRSKSVICETCRGYCIKYDMDMGNKHYVCDKCEEYRGYIRKNGEKQNLIDAYLD